MSNGATGKFSAKAGKFQLTEHQSGPTSAPNEKAYGPQGAGRAPSTGAYMRKQAVIGVLTLAVAIGTVAAVGAGALDGTSEQNSGITAKAGNGTLPKALAPSGLKAVGLTTDQRLVAFRVDRPGSAAPLGKINGLKGDKTLIGIDYRVQNNKLYGVGDRGGIYTIREAGARATKVSQLTVALQGKSFGVDFNRS